MCLCVYQMPVIETSCRDRRAPPSLPLLAVQVLIPLDLLSQQEAAGDGGHLCSSATSHPPTLSGKVKLVDVHLLYVHEDQSRKLFTIGHDTKTVLTSAERPRLELNIKYEAGNTGKRNDKLFKIKCFLRPRSSVSQTTVKG